MTDMNGIKQGAPCSIGFRLKIADLFSISLIIMMLVRSKAHS